MRFGPRQPDLKGPVFPIRLWFACPHVNQLAGGAREKNAAILCYYVIDRTRGLGTARCCHAMVCYFRVNYRQGTK